MYDVSYSELPSVDDLEVAAAAAAAARDPDNVTSGDDTDSSSENDEVRFHCMMTQMCVPTPKSVCEVVANLALCATPLLRDQDESSEESSSSGYQSSNDDQMHSSMQLIRLELVVSGQSCNCSGDSMFMVNCMQHPKI